MKAIDLSLMLGRHPRGDVKAYDQVTGEYRDVTGFSLGPDGEIYISTEEHSELRQGRAMVPAFLRK